MGGNGIRLGISGLYFVLLTRLLGAEGFGWFSALLACSQLVSPFAQGGQPDVLIQWLSRRPQDLYPLWTHACCIALAGGIAITGVLLYPLHRWLPDVSIQAIALILISEVVVFGLQAVHKGMLIALERIPQVALIDTGMAGARLLTAGLALALGWKSLDQWSILYVGMALMVGLVTYGFIQYNGIRSLKGNVSFWQKTGRQQLKTGWDFAVGGVAVLAFSDVDKLLLPRLKSAAAAGVYSAAYRIVTFAQTPIMSLITSGMAELSRQGEQGLQHGWTYGSRLGKWVIGYGCLGTLGLWILAGLIPQVLGASYAETRAVLRWLSSLVLWEGLHLLLAGILTGANLHRSRSWLQLGALGLNLGLNLLWIPHYSWRGAVLATLVSEFALLVGLGGLIWVHASPNVKGCDR
jgi:O-antigen/teichoic acid export membrane protein